MELRRPNDEGKLRLLKYFTNRTLRFDILTIFLFLISFSSITIIAFTYLNMSKSLLEFSNGVIVRASGSIREKINDLIDNAEDSTREASILISNSKDLFLREALLTAYMTQLLKDQPNIYGLYYGVPDGSFLEAVNLGVAHQTHFIYDSSKPLPPNSAYALRIIDRSTPNVSDTWYYKDANLQTLATESNPNPTFNPVIRPWYHGAIEKKGHLFWTPIYHFDPLGEAGVSVARARFDSQGNLITVIGVDITLDLLSQFLTSEKIGKSGKAFILDSSGKVLIPQDISEFRINQDVISTAFQEKEKGKKSSFLFKAGNVRYIGAEYHFSKQQSFDWIIMVIVPIQDFLGELFLNQKRIALISLGIMIFASLFVVYFSNRISSPIVELAKETNKIRHLDFESEIRVHSNIYEIKLMDESLAAMRVAIRSFGRYIPKEIVTQLIAKGQEIAIGGEKRETTVMFSDIEGFTSIAETYDTEKLMVLLSEYFDALSKILLKNQGNIDKFIGDGIMAIWGAPRELPSQALHACRAALECQAYLSDFNERLEKEGKPVFRTRIGIDIGETIVGNVGTAERMNYTAMGNTVNTASRLQSENKIYHTSILISDRVRKKIGEEFLVRPLDIVELKGKKEKTMFYELLNKTDAGKADLCALFTKAFDAFQNHDHNAKALFQQILKSFPSDIPTQIYLERLS